MVLTYDERQHQALDQYLQPHRPRKIPALLKRRLIFAMRTVYTTAICLVASYRYQWGDYITYLSPVLSAISTSLSLGEFLKKFVQVGSGSLIGMFLGVGIAYTYEYTAALLTLLFLSLVFINHTSLLDQTGKVFGGLNLSLAALLPYISDGKLIGGQVIKVLLAVIFIPYLITCATLLIPIPVLAIEAAKSKAEYSCRELSAIAIVLVRGFVAQDFHDLYSADFDDLYRNAEESLVALNTFLDYARHECWLFPWLDPRVKALAEFHKLSTSLLYEYAGLRNMLKLVKNNYTQGELLQVQRSPSLYTNTTPAP
jgi:hypothetical protein